MKVLILGCGYTGQRLAHWLLKRHIPVKVTTRTGSPLPNLEVLVNSFAYGDETRPLALEALQDVTHVLSSIPPANDGADPVVALLLRQLQSLDLQWFGYLSTTGVYGDAQGAWVDETSELKPSNVRSQHRVNIESIFLSATLPTHIFRLPGIYGPGCSIFDRLQSGKVQRINKPGHVFSRIHVDDIVQTVGASMLKPEPNNIYNVTDNEPSEPSTLIVEAHRLMGSTPPPAVPFDLSQMSPMAASFWNDCRRVSNQKIKENLGIKLLYPTYREGLQAIWAFSAAAT
jgi:nucleoside-diphosphate-sugar epimerase